MSAKDKLRKLAEAIVCGPDDDKALADELRKAQEEADKQKGKS